MSENEKEEGQEIIAGAKAISKAFGGRTVRWLERQIRTRTKFASVVRRDDGGNLWAFRSEIKAVIAAIPRVCPPPFAEECG